MRLFKVNAAYNNVEVCEAELIKETTHTYCLKQDGRGINDTVYKKTGEWHKTKLDAIQSAINERTLHKQGLERQLQRTNDALATLAALKESETLTQPA
jgi:hypothetical protein